MAGESRRVVRARAQGREDYNVGEEIELGVFSKLVSQSQLDNSCNNTLN